MHTARPCCRPGRRGVVLLTDLLTYLLTLTYKSYSYPELHLTLTLTLTL